MRRARSSSAGDTPFTQIHRAQRRRNGRTIFDQLMVHLSHFHMLDRITASESVSVLTESGVEAGTGLLNKSKVKARVKAIARRWLPEVRSALVTGIAGCWPTFKPWTAC